MAHLFPTCCALEHLSWLRQCFDLNYDLLSCMGWRLWPSSGAADRCMRQWCVCASSSCASSSAGWSCFIVTHLHSLSISRNTAMIPADVVAQQRGDVDCAGVQQNPPLVEGGAPQGHPRRHPELASARRHTECRCRWRGALRQSIFRKLLVLCQCRLAPAAISRPPVHCGHTGRARPLQSRSAYINCVDRLQNPHRSG